MPTLSDITTAASRLKPLSKRALFDRFVADFQAGEFDSASTETLAVLYTYFLPNTSPKTTSLEQWVRRAVAKNDIRHQLNYLYSDGVQLHATDGRRGHVGPTTLPAGYYDAALTPVIVDIAYPGFERINQYADEVLAIDMRTLPIELCRDKTHAYCLPNGDLLDRRYLDEARDGLETFILTKCTSGAYRLDIADQRYALIGTIRR